ncbi:autoinducer binding domain-containing protein [Sulfitobacter sp. PR48]|uniref:helix-turn-helix transcriptional regulator n=1 Tax=unclassified Sulfitobacter TaxID=196795 RepID=UPI0022AFA775|nr:MULTISPECIES: autoinducer binding domain-containing protein [unclassified Sulfitobacter]MCZ4255104.1 autoinducer binding domain-containing protein [Sulfitobacter sp. G21635-S1]MDD9722992.1 autoinducer binding domain-containing protein [Sulfitobacter sp. PR48]
MVKTRQIDFIMEALEQADSHAGLQSATEALRDLLGIDHVLYHWVDSTGEQYGCGTYSVAWQERYIAQNYLRIDPVVLGCFQRFHPVDWKQLDWSSKTARAFFAEALEYGVGNQGLSVPLRGPNGQFALFTINHSCMDAEWEAFVAEHRHELILIAHFLNEKALEFEPDRLPETAQALSPREVDAMTLLAAGQSRAQVADQLQISEHTLRVYIESARFKLGALNTTHAVARALSRGLIVV